MASNDPTQDTLASLEALFGRLDKMSEPFNESASISAINVPQEMQPQSGQIQPTGWVENADTDSGEATVVVDNEGLSVLQGRAYIVDDTITRVPALPALPDASYPAETSVYYNGKVWTNTDIPRLTNILGDGNVGDGRQASVDAVSYNGYTYFAYYNPDSDAVHIRRYDETNRTLSKEYTIIPNVTGGVTDTADTTHARPTMVIRSDGYIMVWASGHGTPELWQWTSAAAEDIATAGTLTDIGALNATYAEFTYPYAHQFGSGRIMLIYRSYGKAIGGHTGCKWGYSVSDDSGGSWSSNVDFWAVASRGPYVYPGTGTSTRWDIGLHDGNSGVDANNALYHGYTDGTNFYNSSGVQFAGSGPWTTTDATLVYQPTGTDYVAGTHAIYSATNSNPRIAFQERNSTGNMIKWAREGSPGVWTKKDITTYTGARDGVAIDPTSEYIVYGPDNNGRMVQYETSDNGDTWSTTNLTGTGIRSQQPKQVKGGSAIRIFFARWLDNVEQLYHQYAYFSGGDDWTEVGYLSGVLIQDGIVQADGIRAGTIKASHIASSAITTGKLRAGAVVADSIAASAIETSKLDAEAVTAAKIATGTITATQIAAGTLTATEIASGAITTDKLAANAVTADKIAAATIRAGNLVDPSNGNLIPNGTFEDTVQGTGDDSGSRGWSVQSGTTADVNDGTSNPHSGSRKMRIQHSSDTTTNKTVWTTDLIPAGVGTYRLKAWVTGNAANSTVLHFQFRLFSYDSDGNQLASAGSSSNNIAANGTYAQYTWNRSVADGAAYIRIALRLVADAGTTGDEINIDDVECYRQDQDIYQAGGNVVIDSSGVTIDGGSLVVKDSGSSTTITGGKVVTNGITAGNVTSATIASSITGKNYGSNSGSESSPSIFLDAGTNTGIYGTSTTFAMSTGGSKRLTATSSGNSSVTLLPYITNSADLGSASKEWKDIYLVNSPTVSSDRNMKMDIVDENLGLKFIRSLRPRRFKFRETGDTVAVEQAQFDQDELDAECDPYVKEIESIRHAQTSGEIAEDEAEERVEALRATINEITERYVAPLREAQARVRPGRREHHGLISQEVKESLDEAGIDAAFWKKAPDGREFLAHIELIAPLIKAVQELSDKVSALESVIGEGANRVSEVDGGKKVSDG